MQLCFGEYHHARPKYLQSVPDDRTMMSHETLVLVNEETFLLSQHEESHSRDELDILSRSLEGVDQLTMAVADEPPRPCCDEEPLLMHDSSMDHVNRNPTSQSSEWLLDEAIALNERASEGLLRGEEENLPIVDEEVRGGEVVLHLVEKGSLIGKQKEMRFRGDKLTIVIHCHHSEELCMKHIEGE